MWHWGWTNWHWDRFFPKYFGFSLSFSFHGAPLLGKGQKIIFIFIIGLHKKP
jgi:hypothetical protein